MLIHGILYVLPMFNLVILLFVFLHINRVSHSIKPSQKFLSSSFSSEFPLPLPHPVGGRDENLAREQVRFVVGSQIADFFSQLFNLHIEKLFRACTCRRLPLQRHLRSPDRFVRHCFLVLLRPVCQQSSLKQSYEILYLIKSTVNGTYTLYH